MDATWPLAGRDEELTRLAAAMDDGEAGVVLAGLPGVGKTRLATEPPRSFFVSVRTVENHLQRAYEKLGVRSRAELAEVLDTCSQRSVNRMRGHGHRSRGA
jgi:Cdc6-like AAA superfamily ATPase